jgi:DNA-binding CsgD family transcriptional regulator
MDDFDRALFEAFDRVWGRIQGDEDEVRARLARRRSAEMQRPPRAWCAAVRASDRRIEPYRIAIVPEYRDGVVERERVTLDAASLVRLCAPLEINEAGEMLAKVAEKLGVSVESLAYARKGGMFRERRGLRYRGTVPILHRDGLIDPSAPLGRTADRLWGWAWKSAARRLPEDFAQEVERVPEYRVVRGRRVGRGWRWVCPGCGKRVRVIFLPARSMNLAEYLGVKAEADELEAVAELPRTFACTRCHRVRYFSRVDRHGWNALIAHCTGGLLYGHEVKRPGYWKLEEPRKRLYRRSAGRAPSKRRAQVREMLLAGKKIKEIGEGFGISVNTVWNYVRVIYREAGVKSRKGLMAVAGCELGV